MNCRPFVESDLATVSEWFADVEWPLPAMEGVLPKIGIIVESVDGVPAACGWLYTTDTTLAFLSWTASNPEISDEEQGQAVDALIEGVQKFVQTGNVKVVMVLSRSALFSQKLKKFNFKLKRNLELATWILKD